jgi:transposase
MAQPMSVLGIDIATQVFHVVGMDDSGHVVRRKRLARRALLTCMANVPPLRLGMEACGRAHDWARPFREQGHDVRLIAPPFITADGKSPTNDAREADAIGEAVTRPPRRCVPITRVEPQDLQARHRVRERRTTARPALVKASRGLLREDGRIWPQRLATVRALIVDTRHEEQAKLTTLSAEVFWHRYDAFRALETRVAYDAEQLAAIGQAHPAGQRLPTLPGSGPVTATALIAAVGDVTPFKHGRHLAAWLGLVPREHSTGGQPRRLGMSTRGDRYRRTLLVRRARAPLRGVDTQGDDRSQGLRALIARRGKTRAAVALATKNARMVWALLAHTQAYRVRTVL